MKRLLLIISAILSLATLQAQYLQTGDIVSISFKDTPWQTYDYYTYMEASSSGILSTNVVNDNCLWRLEVDEQNNTYTFQDLTTGKYLRIDNTGSNQEALVLTDTPNADTRSAFSMTIKDGEEGKYMKGILYYNTVTHWGAQVQLMMSEYGGTFLVAGWNAYDLYIEKWEQKGAGSPTGHFNPSKIEFTYAKDNATANAQATNVEFMIEATTESYYQCVTRDEALLRRSTGNVDGSAIIIENIYWASTGDSKGKSSNLDVSKYVAHQDANRTLMTLSDPVTQSEGKWQFSITPEGASPMGLKDTLGRLERWIDYADNVIVEFTYGNSTTVQRAEMRVVRKSYHEEQLPSLTFSINPVTYTFSIAEETKQFDVTLTHQHGSVIYNVDNQPIKTTYTYPQKHLNFSELNTIFQQGELTKTFKFLNQPASPWLTMIQDEFDKGNIYIRASKNETELKRSDTLVVMLDIKSDHQHKDSFMIPLSQRGKTGGIQFLPKIGQGNTALGTSPHHDRQEQQVHTAERTIYYLPNQDIELRLPESGFSGYMRWYDYETNGDPYYNYAIGKDSTKWVRSPRTANNSAFSAINTPQSDATTTTEGVSHGLYALNKGSRGGVLDESNPSNPAPILKGWNYNPNNPATAHHIMACDVSAYTDYTIWTSQNGARIDSIKEPTLSYRQLFHLRPASEMANKLASLGDNEYLEEYQYIAPAGKQILLSTEFRHSKVRSHTSELCYFYWDGGTQPARVNGNVTWQQDGDTITPRYIAELDYLIVRSEVPDTVTYTLTVNGTGQRIARFVVAFVDVEKYGPTNKTIITQQRINAQYKKLTEINFDDLNTHLGWNEASYGYVYTTGNLAQDAYFKRGATQGAFPYYGEYMLTTGVDKDWAREPAHGGKGQSLYVDGTMEPGLVATISASGQICSGQTMYCSAWFCNPAPSGWSGEGNPIFRCNIQGKNDNETEWHDVGVYFVGELLKGSKWQQVVFPIEPEQSYDRIRVSIYNFATTNQGNDFMVDDINLFVSQLPLTAYQGEMACRSVENGETTAAAVLRLDYNNISAGSDGYMFYQMYNETFTRNDTTGFPVILKGDAAYYHDYDVDHGDDDHNHPYGSVLIPEQGFDPEAENSELGTTTYSTASSVSSFLDSLVLNNLKHGKAYIKTNNDGATKWLLYVAHIISNTDQDTAALSKLHKDYSYVMRMAYTPEELPTAACNLTTPLHATQKTEFQLRNSANDVILHDNTGIANNNGEGNQYFSSHSSQNCPNDLYFLTSTVINYLALETGDAPVDIAAPIYADWLIGDPAGDVLSEKAPVRENYNTPEEYTAALADYNTRLQASIAGFKEMYGGYTHDQVATAIMYDMRRVPTSKDNNPNYRAKSFKELDPTAFLSRQNYEIVSHLYENGWLQLCDTTVHFYLGSRLNKNGETIGDTVRYWCFPIEGTAKTMVKDKNGQDVEITLKDCNEPHRVMVSATGSDYYYNIAPITFANKTPQQSVQLPALKVLKGSTTITFPVTELGNKVTTAGQDGRTIRLNLADATYINLETGQPYQEKPELVAGNEYTIRLTLLDQYTNKEGLDGECRYGYAFLKLQILPSTLVWSPSGDSFNGWGKDENWKVWNDKDGDNQIDQTELSDGYVPIEGTNVIIPKMTNTLLYPYIVSEHTHNHYPMTINFQPHHCNNIYFASGTHIYNQHLLDYEKAFVDMSIPTGGWHMMSAPLQSMYAGDMFVPHDANSWYNSGDTSNKESTDPFVVKSFIGRRHNDAAYAFWQAYYNTTVREYNEGGGFVESASAEFNQTNTLADPHKPGSGFNVYALGPEGYTGDLMVRLPKSDTEYYYYTDQGVQSNIKTPNLNRDSIGRFAFIANHTDQEMEITLTNETTGEYFLFGNPTMAYVDLHALYQSNQTSMDGYNTWTGEYTYVQGSAAKAGTQSFTTSDRYLPPMTSVLLSTTGENKQLKITLTPNHLTLNNQINLLSDDAPSPLPRRQSSMSGSNTPTSPNVPSELMTIYAFSNSAYARTILATTPMANDYYQVGEDALFISSGVENESYVTTPLNMYTVAEQVPMMADVRQGISEVPLAILAADEARANHMQLAFYLSSNWTRECYFYDSATGQSIRIMDGLLISVEMPQNHEQRYFIQGPDEHIGESDGSGGVTTSTTNPSTNEEASFTAYSLSQASLHISSNQLIQEVTLYDLAGRVIAQRQLDLFHTAVDMPAPSGMCLVKVTLRNGTTLYRQALVR